MAHLLCLPVLLFLAVHVSHGSLLPPSYDDSMCSESSMCGGVNITYPFYLSDATRSNPDYTYKSNYSCGYTDLNIFCQDEGKAETPILLLGGHNYTILNISYDNHTIILWDADVLPGNGCPRVSHNVSFDEQWLKYTDSFDSLDFFLDCYSKPDDDLPSDFPKEKYQITCNPPAGSVSFVFFSGSEEERNVSEKYHLADHCGPIFVVPVLEDAQLKSNPTVLPNQYGAVLKRGFELEWNLQGTAQQACHQCEQSGGRCSYSESKTFLGCLCPGGKVGDQDCQAGSSSGDTRSLRLKRRKLYIIADTSSITLLCLLFFACLLGYKRYGSTIISKVTSRIKPIIENWTESVSKRTRRIESFLQKNGTPYPKRFKYAEVKRITKSFTAKLGQGGFGAVYRGNLSDGRHVAVKMLQASKGDGEDFINEVASISRTSHVNIVSLLGFCLEGSKRALIYEYMPNGSLERYAFNNSSKDAISITWEKLFDIAVGIARGLEYLHRGCNTRIVHFDIKPHNVLLDQEFCPKISDFGMAKLCVNKESIISIGGARGTIGYIAPEVFSKQFGAVSSKFDVYSYGMMVLEMVGAREKNINDSESSSQYFPQWIYEHLDDYCVGAAEINGEITEIVRKMIVVGLWCIQVNPTNRPTMSRVLGMLEGSTSGLELPPKVLLSFVENQVLSSS